MTDTGGPATTPTEGAEMSDLKPCPFCGATEHLFIENREERNPDYKSDHVVCRMCGAVQIKDDCLGWNNRPTEKAAREEVLELASAAQCDECRTGVKLVSNYQGYSSWWVHLNEKGGFSDDCSADEIRQAYQERFGE